ncbi:MAG: putative PEP-binding protein, partial [Patescibacteria group bacterium]
EEITASCAEGEVGYVYKGILPFEVHKTEIKEVAPTKTKIMMNVGDPDSAFSLSAIPNDGVGLAREEFIFTNFVKIHPLALVNYKKQRGEVKRKIDELTVGYADKSKFCVDKLAEGIAFIASAFHPHDVIVRLSDFKTNEYATLIGGHDYEPKEENPMLGWRGASRYYDEKYKPGFKLECEALKKVREEWGLKNVIIMVPFCRTVEEGKKVLKTMKEFGLERGKNGLKVYVMCEIPSNVILANEFSQIFDGFSIGSNDLTQLTLGVDRDSALVSHVYDEKNEAVKTLIRQVIKTAHQYKRKVGICGQAPSDYPEFAEFLVQEGIDSISLNPDTVLKTRQRIAAMEKKVGVRPSALKVAMATKMLLIFGVLGLATIMGGYACQTTNNKSGVELQATIVNEVAIANTRLRQALEKKFEDEKIKERSQYDESGFYSYRFYYPAFWSVSHAPDRVEFNDKNGLQFSVEVNPLLRDQVTPENLSTTTWQGFKAKTWELTSPSGLKTKVLDIYPNGYKKSEMVEIAGSDKYFDEILSNFEFFVSEKK